MVLFLNQLKVTFDAHSKSEIKCSQLSKTEGTLLLSAKL